MRRRGLCLGLVAAVAAGSAGFVAVRSFGAPAHRITREAAAELRPGMTLAEVEAVIGVPAGDYSGGTALPAPGSTLVFPPSWHEWIAEDVCIQAEFDEQGRLLFVLLRDVCLVREPFFHRVGRWVGL